jgi:uncharacterized protein YciI
MSSSVAISGSVKGERGGPFGDRSGGLITFVVDEPIQAEVAIAGDPFVREGLLEHYWLKPWEPDRRDSRT